MGDCSVAINISRSPPSSSKRSRRRRRRRTRKKDTSQLTFPLLDNGKGFIFETEIQCGLSLRHKTGENWPRNHVLSRKLDQNTVEDLINEIKSVDVGLNYSIDWFSLNKLKEILNNIALRHFTAPYKYMSWHYASNVTVGTSRKGRGSSVGNVCRNQVFWKKSEGIDEANPVLGMDNPLRFLLIYAEDFGEYNTQSYLNRKVDPENALQFLISVLRHTVPNNVFGCRENMRIFTYRWLVLLIGIPGCKSVALGRMMNGVKINSIPWSNENGSCCGRGRNSHVVAKVWLWLLLKYLARVLSCHFVHAEVSGRNPGDLRRMLFPKRIWQSWTESAVTAHTFWKWTEEKGRRSPIRGWMLTPVSADGESSMNDGVGSPLTSFLRFAVKRRGVRPIIDVRYLPKDEELKRASQALLRFLVGRTTGFKEPIEELSRAWRKFHEIRSKDLLEKRNGSREGVRRLFAIKVDVEDAFGSVIHEKIDGILCERLQEAGLKIGSMVLVKKMICSKRLSSGTTLSRERYELEVGQRKSDNRQSMSSHSKWYTKWKKVESLLVFIRKCIGKQFVRYGTQLYRLSRGLAQGGIFSPQLWDIYMSDLISKHLIPHFSDASTELIVGVDDVLLLTNSEQKAKWFLDRMLHGFEGYNVYVNPLKIQTNLMDCGVAGMDFITFWGYCMDPENFRMVANYRGYPGRKDIINTINLRVLKNPWSLLEKGDSFNRTKLCYLTLNAELNGERVVLCNIFRGALLIAAHFNATTKVLHKLLGLKKKGLMESKGGSIRHSSSSKSLVDLNRRLENEKTVEQSASRVESVNKSIRYSSRHVLMMKCIRKRLGQFTYRIEKCGEKHSLNEMPSKEEIDWLGYTAFRVVLRKNGSYYPVVLKKIARIHERITKAIPDAVIATLEQIVRLCQAGER